jgi:hypothetical protein
MQVHKGCVPRCLGEAVRHAHHNALMEPEDITEVSRHRVKERQLIGTGIPEDRCEPTASQEFIDRCMDGRHLRLFRLDRFIEG